MSKPIKGKRRERIRGLFDLALERLEKKAEDPEWIPSPDDALTLQRLAQAEKTLEDDPETPAVGRMTAAEAVRELSEHAADLSDFLPRRGPKSTTTPGE